VLEDDASLAFVPQWGAAGLGQTLAALPASWGVLQCYSYLGFSWRTTRHGAPNLARARQDLLAGKLASRRGRHNEMWGAVAYAVSRRGAKELLEMYWPGMEPAGTLDLRLTPVADVAVYSGSETYIANRPLFGHQLRVGSAAANATIVSGIHQENVPNHYLANERQLRMLRPHPDAVSDAARTGWLSAWFELLVLLGDTDRLPDSLHAQLGSLYLCHRLSERRRFFLAELPISGLCCLLFLKAALVYRKRRLHQTQSMHQTTSHMHEV
jgi:hypothetical protein